MVAASLARPGQVAVILLLVALAASGARAGAETAPEPEPVPRPVAAPELAPGPGDEPAAAARGPVTNLPIPRFVSMRAESANARRGPSFDQRVDWEFVHRGLPLEVTGEYGNWRRVRDAEGYGGWVHHTLLSGLRTAIVRRDEAVPLQAGPAETAAVRAMAEPGVIGRVEACAGAWCEIAVGGLRGWLPRAALWGVGADETIE